MKKLTWFILGIAFVTALASLIFLISDTGAQSINDQRRKGDKDQEEISKLKSTFPVVQYDQSELVSPERKKKGAKYDVVPVIRPYIEDNSTEYIANEWAHDLSALPVEKSQAVVMGTVIDAKAYLSEKKEAVYSEFDIQIERVFKNETGKELGPTISVERQGGIVRYPNGFEKWVLVDGQGMPTPQKRYLFFLSYDVVGVFSQQSDLSILTAYELKDGLVFPLDRPGGGTHPIATSYTGTAEKYLFNDLNKSLK